MNKILDPYQAAKLNYLEAFIAAHTENEFEIYTLKTNFIFTRYSRDSNIFTVKMIYHDNHRSYNNTCTEDHITEAIFKELESGEKLFFNRNRKKLTAPISFIVKALTDIPDYVKKKQFIYIIDDSISPFKGE